MNRKSTAIFTAAVLLIAVMLSTLTGCGNKKEKLEYEGFLFDTYISIRIYGGSDEILDEAVELCRQYDQMLDKTNEKSDIWAVNHSDGQPVTVSEQTAQLLVSAQQYSQLSGGIFDVTCGALTSLWDFNAEHPMRPLNSALEQAALTVGADKMSVDGLTVTVQPGTQLDVGGIAKGYIADQIAQYLKDSGIKNAVINFGGNVVVAGDKFGKQYRIGIASPFGAGNIAEVTVSDCSVVTAGTYQRGFNLAGEYYHHILDLTTGMPMNNGLEAVTVISESSEQGDAMATILFLMGLEDGMAFAEQMQGIEALFVTSDGQVMRTSGI